MTVPSTTGSAERQPSAGGALPKVNVRPGARWQKKDDAYVPDASGAASGKGAKPRRADWDMMFALGLIGLVVLVNVTLALLLGNGSSEAGETAENASVTEGHVPALSSVPPLPAIAAETEKSPAIDAYGAISPSAGGRPERKTRVYVTHEDKRLLLRRLNQSGQGEGEQQPRMGEFRALDDPDALSVIGTDRQ